MGPVVGYELTLRRWNSTRNKKNLLDHGLGLLVRLDDVIQRLGDVQEHRVDPVDHDGRA